jgi:hypothetical protein
MSATYEVHDGCTTLISDAGRQRLAAEQRDINVDQQRAEITMFAAAGTVVSIAALVITHLLGKA